jgi:hypothetical protein
MAIPGLKTTEGKPLLKYDARIGRFKVDQREVTSIKLIVDIENAEAGWLCFKEGQTPQFKLVPVTALLNGTEYPATPDPDPNSGWRRGFRTMVKIPDGLAKDRPTIREWASSTLATTRAFDGLHDQWLALHKSYPGKVPLVSCTEVKEIPGQRGSNYQPVLVIERWVNRPADLAGQANGSADEAPPFDDIPGEPEVRGSDLPEDFADLE